MHHQVLVVDDDEMNSTLIAKILELEGFQVTVANSGIGAIQSVIQKKPDLITLDIRMPDISGFDLCRKLRQPPLNVRGPIILLTAMNSDVERRQAMLAGANDIWSKPLDVELFRRRIGELLTPTRPLIKR